MPPAHAHYLEPPGDWNAAPAVVQVETTFRFTVNLVDRQLGLRPYQVEVPGPRGTGAIFDPSGAVVTTREIVSPGYQQARVEGVNRGFAAARPPGWTTPPDMSKRHTVANPETNRQLQACYAPGSGCITFLGRVRTVVLNTVPVKRLPCSGPKDIGDGLVVLPSRDARSDATPTVGVDAGLVADSPFVALGYNGSQRLTRFTSRLVDGKLTNADAKRIRTTFASNGAGTVLVGTEGKGSVLGVVVPTEDGMQLVAAQAALAGAGYRPIRGPLHQRIDEAIGFFFGKHYSHAIPLLEKVTGTLSDDELVKDLKVAKAKAGTAEDVSYANPMDPATSTDSGGLPWAWIGLAGVVLAGAAVVAGLLLRGRANRGVETADDGYDDFEDFDDPAAAAFTPGQPSPDASDLSGPAGSASAVTQPMGRTEPGVAVVEADRPAEDQRAVRYCTSCGAALAAGDRFCYSCGTPAR